MLNSTYPGSPTARITGVLAVVAVLSLWPSGVAAQGEPTTPCTNQCEPFESTVYTKIILSEVNGACGITPFHKQRISRLIGEQDQWVAWNICSTCPYDSEVTTHRWDPALDGALQRSLPNWIGEVGVITQSIKRCGEADIFVQIDKAARPNLHNFGVSVRTGSTTHDYDPQLQIRGGPGMVFGPWTVLVCALLGLVGGVMLGRYLFRARA